MCIRDRDNFRKKLRSGELNDNEVEIPVSANANLSLPTMDIPGMPGSQMGMINLGDVFGKGFGNQKKMKKMSVKDSHAYLLNEETDKLLDKDKIYHKFNWQVEKYETDGPLKDCWLTTMVSSPIPLGSSI